MNPFAFLAITFGIAIQGVLCFFLVKEFIAGEPDREDVLLLIPGAWIILCVWYVVKGIPAALKRKPRS